MRRPRQHLPETSANNDRWLLTYADMITLLTAFFLMLYSMSVMSKGKFSQLALAVRGSFAGTASSGNRAPSQVTPQNQLGLSSLEYPAYADSMRNLAQYVEQNKL